MHGDEHIFKWIASISSLIIDDAGYDDNDDDKISANVDGRTKQF